MPKLSSILRQLGHLLFTDKTRRCLSPPVEWFSLVGIDYLCLTIAATSFATVPSPFQSVVYFFMIGFSYPIVFQVVLTIFLFAELPPRPHDQRERANCCRQPLHPELPGFARRSDQSVPKISRPGRRLKHLPDKAAM